MILKAKIAAFLSVILIIFSGCSVKTADEYYSQTDNSGDISVKISINCSTILDNTDMLSENLVDYVPQDGVILSETEIFLDENATAFDALKTAAQQSKIQYEYEGTNADIYIEGIAHIYEFSCGQLSGWQYCVNGVFPSVGCNSYLLSKGDRVEFLYTCDLGADIGNAYTGE